MSDTYTGWDGNSYPWPPPDGWYEASDGRWWAPGTGPNPPPQTPAPPSHPAGAPAPEAGDQSGGGHMSFDTRPVSSGPDTGETPTSALPHVDPSSSGPATPARGLDYGATSAFPANELPPAPSGEPPTGQAAPIDINYPSPDVPVTSRSGGSGGRRLLFIGLGVVLAVLVLGGGYYAFSGTSEETAGPSGDISATTVPGDTPTTATGDTTDTSTDGVGETTAATDGDETDDEASTTTVGVGSSTSMEADPENVDRFRALLRDQGLTSNRLDDADVVGFGNSFCSLANQSESPDVFDEFRQNAIDSTSNSTLDPDELRMVIDSAIIAFCPDEAERLGIGG